MSSFGFPQKLNLNLGGFRSLDPEFGFAAGVDARILRTPHVGGRGLKPVGALRVAKARKQDHCDANSFHFKISPAGSLQFQTPHVTKPTLVAHSRLSRARDRFIRCILDSWTLAGAGRSCGPRYSWRTCLPTELNRSQSTISYAAGRLQEQLDVRLFEIRGRKLHFTAARPALLLLFFTSATSGCGDTLICPSMPPKPERKSIGTFWPVCREPRTRAVRGHLGGPGFPNSQYARYPQ